MFKELRDSELSRTISTVDDLDLTQGPLTVMLALSDLTCVPPVVGNYGYGTERAASRLRRRVPRPRHVGHHAVKRALQAGAVALVCVVAAPFAAGTAGHGDVDRVLVVSLPAVEWSDLERVDTPNLHRLLSGSAVGSLTTNGIMPDPAAATAT